MAFPDGKSTRRSLHADDPSGKIRSELNYGDDDTQAPDNAAGPPHRPSASTAKPGEGRRDNIADGVETRYAEAKDKGLIEEDYEPAKEKLEGLDYRDFLHPEGIAIIRRLFTPPTDKPELGPLLAGVASSLLSTVNGVELKVNPKKTSLQDLGFPKDTELEKVKAEDLRPGQVIYGLIHEDMRDQGIPLDDPTYISTRAGPMILKCYRMIVRYILGEYAHVYLCVTRKGSGFHNVPKHLRHLYLMVSVKSRAITADVEEHANVTALIQLFAKGSAYRLHEDCIDAIFSESEEEREGSMIQRIEYRVHLKCGTWRKAKKQFTPDSVVRLFDVDWKHPVDRRHLREILHGMPPQLIESLRSVGTPRPGEEIVVEDGNVVRLVDAVSRETLFVRAPRARPDIAQPGVSKMRDGDFDDRNWRDPQPTYDDETTVAGARNDARRGDDGSTRDTNHARKHSRGREPPLDRSVKSKLHNGRIEDRSYNRDVEESPQRRRGFEDSRRRREDSRGRPFGLEIGEVNHGPDPSSRNRGGGQRGGFQGSQGRGGDNRSKNGFKDGASSRGNGQTQSHNNGNRDRHANNGGPRGGRNH